MPGTIVGRVVEEGSFQPVASAMVTLADGSAGALTGSDGRFVLTGVPAGRHTLRVSHISYGDAEREVEVRPGADARVRVVLTPEAVEVDTLKVEVEGPESRTRLSGRVLEGDTRRPVSDVHLFLEDLNRHATSSGGGTFIFEDVPAGEHVLRLEHLGYRSQEVPIYVPENQALGLTLRLDPEAFEMEELRVTVEGEIRLPRLVEEGFYRRRAITSGHFFGPQYMTKWPSIRLAHLFRRAPGIRTERSHFGGKYKIINTRYNCQMPVFVDDRIWKGPLDLPGTAAAAVEIYRGPTDAAGSGIINAGAGPASVGRCGAIYVWTWRRANPYRNLDWGDWEEISCPLSRMNRTGC